MTMQSALSTYCCGEYVQFAISEIVSFPFINSFEKQQTIY